MNSFHARHFRDVLIATVLMGAGRQSALVTTLVVETYQNGIKDGYSNRKRQYEVQDQRRPPSVRPSKDISQSERE